MSVYEPNRFCIACGKKFTAYGLDIFYCQKCQPKFDKEETNKEKRQIRY